MLRELGRVPLPPHADGGYDHADIHLQSGKVYIAHTGNGSVEVVDGERMRHIATIPGCPEASGILCAQSEGLVFAASRGEGKVLVIDAGSDSVKSEIPTGPAPNGLAWDSKRRRLLVADVKDNRGRLLDPSSGETLVESNLRGRPRWCIYNSKLDVFMVNIREPSGVALTSPDSMAERDFVPVSAQGAHGLEMEASTGHAFVACDDKTLVVLGFPGGDEAASVPLSGAPDVLWFNPVRRRLYCAIGEPGVIDAIDIEELKVSESVPTERGAHTLAFDADRQRLYSPLPGSNCLGVYAEE